MTLRATTPTAVTKRLKLFLYGPAGVGKTTAAVQFPRSYIIDAERGTDNYDKLIRDSGSAVFQTNDINEAISEVRALTTERHDYRTLVIDPITTLYNDLLEKCENKVGSAHGRHYGEANKAMKRLANLILALDMNVIVTAHAKTEYGENLAKLGYTFDGWRQLDYWFDLVVELGKKNKKRFAKVVKTRLDGFPDDDVFEWNYDAIKRRYDVTMLEKDAATVALAAPEQVWEIKELLGMVRLPEGTVDKWFARAGVDLWEDLPADAIAKCIEYVRGRLPAPDANGNGRHNRIPPASKPAGDIGADEAFEIQLGEALDARGFDGLGRDRVKVAVCNRKKVALLRELSAEDRKALLAAVTNGDMDKFKSAPAAREAVTV